MQGTIKTYLKEKGYGFIKGDDSKDYYFHVSNIVKSAKAEDIFDGLYVTFEQKATPKGYAAISIQIPSTSNFKYIVPDQVYISKENDVEGWDTLERSDWTITGSSRNSPDEAKGLMKKRAKSIGANAVVNFRYYKATGSEMGTGSGTHHFTIHNFIGEAVNIGKKNINGTFEVKDFCHIDESAVKLKEEMDILTRKKKRDRILFLFIGLFIALILSPVLGVATIIIVPIIIIVTLISVYQMEKYGDWLEKKTRH